MDDTQLVHHLRQHIDTSTGVYWKQLNYERAKALKYYLGEPYGNELDGRSRIVTTEVQDTIEAMLPQILKVFVASDKAVFFEPVGPEDEEAAKQETDYVNHVFYKDNSGFDVLYTWFKDGLMSKNGIVKYWWEEKEEVTTSSYTNLNDQELMFLLSDDEVEVIEQTTKEEIVVADGMQVQEVRYDVKIRRTEKTGQVRIENVPPEEFLVKAEWNKMTLKDVPFCAHETYTTISDLNSRGFDTKELEQYASGGDYRDWDDIEEYQRFKDISDDPFNAAKEDVPVDPSMRKVRLHECYVRVDYNDDGYAELRRIVLVNNTYLLENEEIDYIPFESVCPIPMTHRFFGRSVADQTMDLQLQKSMLTRNILDNMYQINNQRYVAAEGEVDIGSLLDSTPGGVVMASAPNMVAPLPTTQLSSSVFGMLEYLDSIKENRTGITRYNQGIDADSLNKTAAGITRIMDAAQARVELIARLYGEGVKRLMLGIHRLLLQNQDKEKVIRLRGQWIPINPSEWRERTDMSVVVGLGTENKDRMIGHLMALYQIQKENVQAGSPLVSFQNVFNTLSKLVENSGLKEPTMFVTDPSTVEPQPPQPDPQMEMVKGQLQVASQDSQVKAQENAQDYDIALKELQLKAKELELKEREVALKEIQAGIQVQNEALESEVEATRAEMGMAS